MVRCAETVRYKIELDGTLAPHPKAYLLWSLELAALMHKMTMGVGVVRRFIEHEERTVVLGPPGKGEASASPVEPHGRRRQR